MDKISRHLQLPPLRYNWGDLGKRQYMREHKRRRHLCAHTQCTIPSVLPSGWNRRCRNNLVVVSCASSWSLYAEGTVRSELAKKVEEEAQMDHPGVLASIV